MAWRPLAVDNLKTIKEKQLQKSISAALHHRANKNIKLNKNCLIGIKWFIKCTIEINNHMI